MKENETPRLKRALKPPDKFTPSKTDFKKYCICNREWDPTEGAMVACDYQSVPECRVWYHFGNPFNCTSYNDVDFPEGLPWACPFCEDDRGWLEPDFKEFLAESSHDILNSFNESIATETESENYAGLDVVRSKQLETNPEPTSEYTDDIKCRNENLDQPFEPNEIEVNDPKPSMEMICKLLDLSDKDLEYQPPRYFDLTFQAEIWKKFLTLQKTD